MNWRSNYLIKFHEKLRDVLSITRLLAYFHLGVCQGVRVRLHASNGQDYKEEWVRKKS